ncbi:MAG: trypsin-like serine protease [Nannocystaceae bacterium]|nr:trypsin-like serine protease [Nannocystaceae bacterium]
MSRPNCPNCSPPREGFDAEVAFKMLMRRHVDLARLLAQHVGTEALSDLAERIVGGFPVAPATFPECCLVGRRLGNGLEDWFCTGVLIHPRVVLTAAHCYAPGRTPNVVGLGLDKQYEPTPQAEVVSIKRVVPHPDYVATGVSDIAVLVLRTAAETLPVPVATTEQVAAAQATTLVGFGNNDLWSASGFGTKRRVSVPIVSLRRSDADNLDAAETKFDYESDLEFVAGGDGFDTCNGDSGGPAYISVDGELRVAGLTSRAAGQPVLPCGDGGIYTRCDAHMDFVRKAVAGFGIEL